MENVGTRLAQRAPQGTAGHDCGQAGQWESSRDRESPDLDPLVESRRDRLTAWHEEVDPMSPIGEEGQPAPDVDAVRVPKEGEAEWVLGSGVQCDLLRRARRRGGLSADP